MLNYENMAVKGSDATLKRGYEVDGVKVRHSIRLNSYDFQSTAVAQVWSPTDLRWNEIASLPHTAWATDTSVYGPESACFEALGEADAELEARVRATLA